MLIPQKWVLPHLSYTLLPVSPKQGGSGLELRPSDHFGTQIGEEELENIEMLKLAILPEQGAFLPLLSSIKTFDAHGSLLLFEAKALGVSKVFIWEIWSVSTLVMYSVSYVGYLGLSYWESAGALAKGLIPQVFTQALDHEEFDNQSIRPCTTMQGGQVAETEKELIAHAAYQNLESS